MFLSALLKKMTPISEAAYRKSSASAIAIILLYDRCARHVPTGISVCEKTDEKENKTVHSAMATVDDRSDFFLVKAHDLRVFFIISSVLSYPEEMPFCSWL